MLRNKKVWVTTTTTMSVELLRVLDASIGVQVRRWRQPNTLVTTPLSHKVSTVFCLHFYVVHSTATISTDTQSCRLYLNYQLCYCTSVDMVATYCIFSNLIRTLFTVLEG